MIQRGKTLFPGKTVPTWAYDLKGKVTKKEGEYHTRHTKRIMFNDYRWVDEWRNLDDVQHVMISGLSYIGKDRKLAKFSDGSYGIQYYNDTMFSWYYSQNGKLINFTQKDSESYPHRVTKFKPDGSVANTGYRVSEKESFIFTPDGKLLAHWLGNNCYDENNNVIMKRQIIK